MTDEQEDALASEVVANFRSLVVQNDGVLKALIRDAIHYAVAEAVKRERESWETFGR